MCSRGRASGENTAAPGLAQSTDAGLCLPEAGDMPDSPSGALSSMGRSEMRGRMRVGGEGSGEGRWVGEGVALFERSLAGVFGLPVEEREVGSRARLLNSCGSRGDVRAAVWAVSPK